jgi:hypothetical protein
VEEHAVTQPLCKWVFKQIGLHGVKRLGESASADCVAGTEYLENIEIIEEKDCLLQRIFSFYETSLKFKKERENVMSHHTGWCTRTCRKRQSS